MSEVFIIVNHDRSEYFRPMTLGESGKLGGVVGGPISTLAVSLLSVRSTRVKPRDKTILMSIPLFGAWHGGKIELLGQYDERHRDLATRYVDISLPVIALLSHAAREAVDHFVAIFGHANLNTVEVGNAVFAEDCGPLRDAIEERYGAGWTKLLKEAASKCGTVAERRSTSA